MKKKTILFFVLLIAASLWLFICTFSALVHMPVRPESIGLWGNFFVNLPCCLLIGYADYRVAKSLQKRFPDRNGIRIASSISLTALLVGVLAVAFNYAAARLYAHPFSVAGSVFPIVLWNSLIVLFIELFFYHRRQVEQQRRLSVMEKEKALYQFETLKNQINPHFLFNSLNVLASLAYEDAEKTNRFAKKLSGVYRYLLTTHGRPSVSVAEELAFVESYLYLARIRFGNALRIEIADCERWHDRQIIPASVQMLVENALKHNIATPEMPLTVQILVGSEGITVANNLQLRSCVVRSGMGLKNLQRQYALYGRRIEIESADASFTVKIPYLDERSGLPRELLEP